MDKMIKLDKLVLSPTPTSTSSSSISALTRHLRLWNRMRPMRNDESHQPLMTNLNSTESDDYDYVIENKELAQTLFPVTIAPRAITATTLSSSASSGTPMPTVTTAGITGRTIITRRSHNDVEDEENNNDLRTYYQSCQHHTKDSHMDTEKTLTHQNPTHDYHHPHQRQQINKNCESVVQTRHSKELFHKLLVTRPLDLELFKKLLYNIKRNRRALLLKKLSGYILFIFVILFNLSTSVSLTAAKQEATASCMFPQRWEGSWFQSGVPQPISIKGSTLSIRGKCIASDGDKFLMVNDKGCHRCVVIYEKHKNVLQYKESECEDMYMDQSNSAAMPVRSSLKSDHNRGGTHPNINGANNGGSLSSGGGGGSSHSRLSSSDQFLFRSQDDLDNCMGCKGRETLQFLCEQIPGDAQLYSMFKENSEPVKCPLKGPFTFTYNRGHGECDTPHSNIESCTEDSRLLLSFQSCPAVPNTESTMEELTCLATWKDGNARYLVGLISHNHASSNEERFRCFVYEKIPSGMGSSSKELEYKLAQSGDATCNGLESAEVGSRIMTLRKAPPAERCDFPAWFKGPRAWQVLMGNSGYVYHPNDGSIHISKQSGYMETRALCEQINKQTETEMMAVVHYTTGCQSGFMCWMFYRRDTHLAELQMGKPANTLEDACAPDYFDINKVPHVTLIVSNPESQICPLEGLYSLRGQIGPPRVAPRHKRNHNHHKRHEIHDVADHSQQMAELQKQHIISSHRSRRNIDDSFALGGARERRDVNNCNNNLNTQRQLLVGCSEPNIIEVRPSCNDGDEVYTCHASWTENHTTFIVARHVGTQHGVCISYRENDGKTAYLYVGDTCYRGTSKTEHLLISSLTSYGSGTCSETSAAIALFRMRINVYVLTFSIISWLFNR